jgi:hypothetical protein
MLTKLKLTAAAAVLATTAGMLGVTSGAAHAATGSFKDGPYASHSPDSGTCGNNWAVDLFNRKFKVTLPANPDGSFTVVETFANGVFLTHAGSSPEACGTTPTNGTLKAGISGTLAGSFTITVAPGAIFNSSGSCAVDTEGECTTRAWVSGFFGTSSTYSIPHYNIVYNASASVATVAHKWTNADTGDLGDIATGTAPAPSATHGSQHASSLS